MLTAFSKNKIAVIASMIYSFSVICLFGVSAIYHRPYWTQLVRQKIRRMDHAAIYILIAGTCTPVSLLGIEPQSGKYFLTLIWSLTSLGLLQSIFWENSPRWFKGILYVFMGWLVIPFVPHIYSYVGLYYVSLLFLGGIIYSIGALVYVLKRPNPYPHFFGYHEIFHLLTIFGAVLHFIVVSHLVIGT
jgi:hemolysin III